MNIAYGIKTDTQATTGLKRVGDYLVIEGSTRPAPDTWKGYMELVPPTNANLLDGFKGQRVWVAL